MRQVVGCVLTDDIDDRDLGTPRIVKVCRAVGETGAEMQQSASGLSSHAGVTVGRPRDYSFEQAQHTPHLRNLIERGYHVDFGRAGIAETSGHVSGNQRAY